MMVAITLLEAIAICSANEKKRKITLCKCANESQWGRTMGVWTNLKANCEARSCANLIEWKRG